MAKKTLVRDQDKFMLRLPPGMRDRVAAAAQDNDQSMNAEIVSRLEESFVDEFYADSEADDGPTEPKASAAEDFPPFTFAELDEIERWNEAYKLTKKLRLLIQKSVNLHKRGS